MNHCYICDLQILKFQATNFTVHREQEHNVWNYVYYSEYLKEKMKMQRQNVTESERRILTLIQKQSYQWMPIHRSLILEQK